MPHFLAQQLMMFASRASEDRPLTPRAPTLSSGAMWLHDSWIARDVRWVAGVALVYALGVIAAVLALNSYFSQTWDVVTFAHAARSFLNGADWAALYAQSRSERYWPYAYPPLHALVIAPLLAIGGAVPDWLWSRVPPLVADIGIGLLLYTVVARRAQAKLARLALAVWLLNPITLYDTAVQGHFEAEWLFFVLLAYLLAESRRGILLPTLALACACLFKQTALIFAVPYWLWLIASAGQAAVLKRFAPVAASVILFGTAILLASLPFLLYSGDYLYMNIQYVAQAPLQTQSWLVALAGTFGDDSLLLRYSALLVLLASVPISVFALRRGATLYLTAILVTLAFFLLSKKVVGYYYVMVLPFALIALLPARHFGSLTLLVASSAWISLSPYLASWANPSHLPVYAALGIVNSLMWLALFIYLWRNLPSLARGEQEITSPRPDNPKLPGRGEAEEPGSVEAFRLMFISIALFLEAVAAALLQPLVANPTSPIRAPIVPPGLESNVVFASIAFAVILLIIIFIFAIALTRGRRGGGDGFETHPRLMRGEFALALAFAPLYFLTFTLTKESTALMEMTLKALGL